ncbi:hypothetical protein JOD14_001876 [Enterococcus lemanii]|nr:hypothetical protein [Enterococcus lemanii]
MFQCFSFIQQALNAARLTSKKRGKNEHDACFYLFFYSSSLSISRSAKEPAWANPLTK